jgi:cytochrome c-type biogenesis protein CcmH/NrfG
MKAESVVFALCGVFFGLLVGWMLGDQYATGRGGAAVSAPPAAAAPAAQPAGTPPPPAPLDEARVRQLREAADKNPSDPQVRTDLANLYFDAERFQDAIGWYEAALKLDPRDVNVSTDLGVSYYYTNQADRAIAQFEHSLSVDPKHTKTLLNMGIVRAFGKQDLPGAEQAWQQVVALAPESAEGKAAKQAIDSMKAAHPGGTGGMGGPP